MKNTKQSEINVYHGPYRGVVMLNEDPDNLGRVKVYVETVYDPVYFTNPILLPWAEVSQDIYGGNANVSVEEQVFLKNNNAKKFTFKDTGKNSVPHKGAIVWVFFEAGNPNYPVIFAAVQGGSTWTSEHPNQHTFITDNIRIVIDEDLDNNNSTQAFEPNILNNSDVSKMAQEITPIKTRLSIQVVNHKEGAVDINLDGNVNLKITGNVFSDITGDIHETHTGNKYICHKGDTYIEERGRTIYNITSGDYKETRMGNREVSTVGWDINRIQGNKKVIVHGSSTDCVKNIAARYGLKGIKDGSQLIQHVVATAFPESCTDNIEKLEEAEAKQPKASNPKNVEVDASLDGDLD